MCGLDRKTTAAAMPASRRRKRKVPPQKPMVMAGSVWVRERRPGPFKKWRVCVLAHYSSFFSLPSFTRRGVPGAPQATRALHAMASDSDSEYPPLAIDIGE